jgi:hypothetical protein
MTESIFETETRLKPDRCPWCNYKLDAAAAVDGKGKPKPGDISLCVKCASPIQFGDNLKVKKISDAAIRDLLSARAYALFQRVRRLLLASDRSEIGGRR